MGVLTGSSVDVIVVASAVAVVAVVCSVHVERAAGAILLDSRLLLCGGSLSVQAMFISGKQWAVTRYRRLPPPPPPKPVFVLASHKSVSRFLVFD